MKTRNIIALLFLSLPTVMYAQGSPAEGSQGQRKFEIIVREDSSLTNTRGIEWQDNNRRLLGTDMFNLYRTTIAGKFTTAGTNIIDLGISFIYDKLASHRKDWMQAVQKECTYTKQLSMQTEIVDFYKEPSVKGAMDPANIVFTGFGCRQTIGGEESGNGQTPTRMPQGGEQECGISQIDVPQGGANGNTSRDAAKSKDVFYVYCSLRTDEEGKQRITNHSKFEVVVDSIYFNPFLCNLPNDSTAATGERIDYDFDKRSNLTFSLTASITSSWINEAIQIYRDIPLGEFYVTARIDKEDLTDNIFTYSRRFDGDTDKAKKVSVTGDCFIVPRSYVGTLDGTAFTNAWGTGQYKVNMQVSESCSINRDYYLEKEEQTATDTAQAGKKTKKNKEEWSDKWKEEWKIIKKRQWSKSLWSNVKDVVISQWTGEEWITTIIEPALTTVVNSGSDLIGGDTDTGMQGGGNATSGSGTGMRPM